MFKKRIISSLLVAVMMLALVPMTSVFAAETLPVGISWETIANDQLKSNVTSDLKLVKKVLDEGDRLERTVVWTSSKPEVVNTDGVVTRWEKDEAVTITGVYGGRTRTYDIIVPAYDKPGSRIWADDYLSSTLSYTVTRWANAQGRSVSSEYSPKQWTFNATKRRFSTQTNYGTWGSNYGLTIDGVEYLWTSRAAVEADTRLKNTAFNFNNKDYIFYYVDKAFEDADGNPFRVGVVTYGSTYSNWTSLYVNVDPDTGAVTVDTTKDIYVALEGYLKQDLSPVVLAPVKENETTTDTKFRSHVNLLNNKYPYSVVTSKPNTGYERFSFRYRQVRKGQEYGAAMRGEPEFVFFHNNNSIAIHSQFGPGAVAHSNRYFGGIPTAYYKDDFSASAQIGKAGYGLINCKIGPACEELEIKTSDEGLSTFPVLTHANYEAWLEIVMETDRANKTTVMYVNGQPVYWIVKDAEGNTYYTPFLNVTASNYDSVRTGFSSPFVEKLFTDYEIENAELVRWTDENVAAVSAAPSVTSVAGDTATINFTRKGAYTVIFADFDEDTDAFVNASYVPVTVTAAGAQDVTATQTGEWDKVFIWSSVGSVVPVIDSVTVADIPAAE